MKELRGIASARVAASADECLALLLDIERYPDWYPEVIRQVEIVSAATHEAPAVAQTTVHLGVGPVRRDFRLLMEISSEAGQIVRLTRARRQADDPEELSVTWRIEGGSRPGETDLAVELSARLDAPRLLPLTGLGDVVAHGFVSAAAGALDRQ